MTPARGIGARWMWLAAAGLMLLEFLVFDRATTRYHARVYPRWTDQTQYLTEAYIAQRQAAEHGWWAGVSTAFRKDSLQGTLHDAAATVVFEVAGGPSRSAALSLNMLAFLAWQAALLFGVTRITGSPALGWMAFGLVLCLAGPWTDGPGSAVDFRLDHAAMCLLGITSVFALLTDGFRSTRWSLAFGFVAGVTLLERFLCGVYFAGIFAAVALWILTGDTRGLRLRNLLLAGLVMLLLAGPVFWLNRTSIYNYYWVGHMAGTDADARASHFALFTSASYLFSGLREVQLGAWFNWTVVAVSALLGAAVWQGRHAPRSAETPSVRGWLFFSLTFLLVPAVVLGEHRQKSVYVLGAIVPGLVLLVLWAWHQVVRRTLSDNPAGRRWVTATAIVTLAAGTGFFLQRQLPSPFTAEFTADANKVNQISDYIFTASREAGLQQPRIGIDSLVDYFDGRTLSLLGFERHKVWLGFTTQFPVGILEEKDELIMARLRECDFVIVTDQPYGTGFYPFDRQMERLYPKVKAWCEQNLRLVDSFPISNRRMSLYQRREMP